jgi:hypothetical protein
MTDFGFRPTTVEAPDFETIDKPYWKLTLNVRDLENTIFSDFTDWAMSGSINYGSWNSDGSNLREGYLRLWGGSTGTLTKTYTFDESGYYLIFMRVLRNTQYTGQFYLTVNGNLLWKKIDATTPTNFGHFETVMYPIKYYSKGSYTFVTNIVGTAFIAAEFYIYPITKYVACSDKSNIERKAEDLDVISLDFTENSVADNNILTVDIPIHDDLFNPNNESAFFTEFSDPITLELGHNYKDAVPKFGGYVIAPVVNGANVELKCMDRMLDLVIQHKRINPCVGTVPTDDTYLQFSTQYDVASYLTGTIEYPLNFSSQAKAYGLEMDYKEQAICNQTLNITGYQKSFDNSQGLRVYPQSVNSNSEFVLWQSQNPVDVANFNILGMDYNIGATPAVIPVNLTIYMYKTGQKLTDAVPYNIVFKGTTTPPNKIATITPVTTNKWFQWLQVDLKASLDTFLGVAKANNYYVCKISLTGNVDSTQAGNPNNYGFYAGWMELSKYNTLTSQFSDNQSKTHFDSLQKLCTENNLVAYIRPGLDRTDDVLYISPAGLFTSPVELNENENVLDVQNWTYDPLNDGLCNFRCGSWTNGTTKAYSYASDNNSILRYRRVKTMDDLSEVANATDATKSVNRYISDNKIKRLGTELTVQGNVLFHPSDYILTEINSKGLSGNYQIRGIEQTLDIDEGKYETILGINRLPGRFRQRQRALMQFYRNNRKVTY